MFLIFRINGGDSSPFPTETQETAPLKILEVQLVASTSFSKEPLRHKHKGKNERQGLRQKGPARVEGGVKCENPEENLTMETLLLKLFRSILEKLSITNHDHSIPM